MRLFTIYSIEENGFCLPLESAFILVGRLKYRKKKSWYISIRSPFTKKMHGDDPFSFDRIYGYYGKVFQIAFDGMKITDRRYINYLWKRIDDVKGGAI